MLQIIKEVVFLIFHKNTFNLSAFLFIVEMKNKFLFIRFPRKIILGKKKKKKVIQKIVQF